MTALIVIGAILLIIILICQIRVGAVVDYSDEGFALSLKFGALRVKLPSGNEKRSKKKLQKQKTPKAEKSRKGLKDNLALAKKFIPLLGEAAGKFKRKIRIDRLTMHVVWASNDPASAAIGFGAGNAVLGILWPAFEQNFRVKSYDLGVDVDFEKTDPLLILHVQTTLRVGQGVVLGLSVGIKALKIYLGIRRENSENKAVQA